MRIAAIDVSGLDWDDDKPTFLQMPSFVLIETDELRSIEIELPDSWEESMEIDLLYLEP